jgi:hypothetical protein
LKLNKSAQALNEFTHLQSRKSCCLPALLGAAYAAHRKGDLPQAVDQCKKYLSINPWDFRTQLFYTSMLCRNKQLDEAFAHASCAAQLRPNNADAQLIVLKYAIAANKQALTASIFRQIGESTVDIDPVIQLRLLDYKTRPEKLLENSSFVRLIDEKIQSAEDPKYGYKILGEP